MRATFLRAAALASLLCWAPGCAPLPVPAAPNLHTREQSIELRAYELLLAYGAAIETATLLVQRAEIPLSVKRALGAAEAAATPAIETLEISLAAYMRARADLDALDANAPTRDRALSALTAASQRLAEALAVAQAPVSELRRLVHVQES